MFKKKQESKLNLQPIERGFYAFNYERAGDFLLFVESQKDCYKFLYMPGANEFYLTLDDYTNSIKRGVLEFVEQLPVDIFEESLELSKQK
jgi:hypothetical protein